MNNSIKVTDIITKEEINSWRSGDIITIRAGTGAGKSFFIKNSLYDHAKSNFKKILMLIHRTNCVNQFQAEIERDSKTDVIEIRTYQHIEAQYKKNRTFDFSQYQYIVSDEFHYFMSDASFNKTTDMSLNAILDQQDKTRIFMSATGNHVKDYMGNVKKLKTIDYELPITFKFVKELRFFTRDRTLESFVQEAIEKNKKSIFFIQSATKAYELYEKYKDHAFFNCGKSDKHYKYVDEEKIAEMLKNERFEELILITTTAMDAGVNIVDESLSHIVCDVKDSGTLIQCIGRKRRQHKDDNIYLHIKSITNQQLGGRETQLRKNIEMADFLRVHGVEAYIKKYQRESDKSGIIYDDVVEGESDKSTKKVNQLMFIKSCIDINEIIEMKKKGAFGYNKFWAEKFGFYDEQNGRRYTVIEEDTNKEILINYLDGIVGKKLYKEDQQALKDIFKKSGLTARTMGIKTLNQNLKNRKLPYMIVSKQTSKIENGKKKNVRFWEVVRT
jgi:hypothetical protein